MEKREMDGANQWSVTLNEEQCGVKMAEMRDGDD